LSRRHHAPFVKILCPDRARLDGRTDGLAGRPAECGRAGQRGFALAGVEPPLPPPPPTKEPTPPANNERKPDDSRASLAFKAVGAGGAISSSGSSASSRLEQISLPAGLLVIMAGGLV